MNITIKTTKFELTDAIKNYVEEKIGKLGKFRADLQIARVELERKKEKHTGDLFRAEITLDAPNKVYRAESAASDIYAAIDLMLPKIFMQIEKSKEKRETLRRKFFRKLRGK